MKKKLMLVFWVLTGLAWFTAVSEAVENPKLLAQHLEQAAAYEVQGIYVDAIAEYESALEYAPGDPEITYRMAEDYLQMGNTAKYVNLSRSLVESHPEMEEVLDELMDFYLGKRDKATAVKYAAELAETQPENACAKKWLVELKGSYHEIYFDYTELTASYRDNLVVSVKDEETGETRYGVLDALGNKLLDIEYETAQPFSDSGYALVVKDGRTVYVDEDGNVRKVPDMDIYESVGMINNERLTACRNGMYGLLDETMNPKTEFVYEDISLPGDNVAAVRKDGKWALIGRSGREKTEYIYDDVIRDEYGIACGQKRVFVKKDGSYHIVDGDGEDVGELTFEEARIFPAEGYAAVRRDGKWGFVDKNGELVIDCQYEDARSFSNGYAAVCQGGRWGFLDITGVMVIRPEFEEAADMTSAGTAAVRNGEWRLIQLDLFR